MSKINPNISKILPKAKRSVRSLEYYVNGIYDQQNLTILAEAITLLESEVDTHRMLAYEIISTCQTRGQKRPSLRIGITGSPGVGKSSFIESFFSRYIPDGDRAAILTIDPSSIDRRGSILGDKTRMDELSSRPEIFIRPSPSRLHLGGVHAYTYEAILLCEAAGIETIIVETVGVGQSEHEVQQLVDISLLLLLPGAGDELQGIKKGITEIADLVVITKYDGERKTLADQIKKDYKMARHISQSNNTWTAPVIAYSSLTGEGYDTLLDGLSAYIDLIESSEQKNAHRDRQDQAWISRRVHQHIADLVTRQISTDDQLSRQLTDTSQSAIDRYLHIITHIKVELKH